MKYKIADLKVDLSVTGRTARNAQSYKFEFDGLADIKIDENYELAKSSYPMYGKIEYEDEEYKREGLNYMLERDTFAKKILYFDGLVLHASAVVVNNEAFLFSAPSGTGKSTHTSKWLELFGDKAYILNDDKPAIRILDDGIYTYGTPWCGSTNISTNAKVKLQGICFIRRDVSNWIKQMDFFTASYCMIYGTSLLLPKDKFETNKELDIINKIVNLVPVYEMGCTPDIQAAQVAYDMMSNKNISKR